MSASSGRHADASRYLRTHFNGVCLFCGETEGVTAAHLVAAVKDCDYKEFGQLNGYTDELEVTSPRNFLPLCGTKGQAGSCHDEFYNYRIALLYNPIERKYCVHCLDESFKDGKVHGNVFEISGPSPPYRRLRAWRSRKAARGR